ncbi:MAG TPA: hybrid sensor histidine kinase/response regulator [Caldithrix abyssi]|uniref:histidine kinase n=1 Tax=Caldithrix abyssi TaxID=187145 RepID=A0A7V4U382_CALAY|nr:hybrid sensor histidine kinase/response regulator [Caldithrix abyssi]
MLSEPRKAKILIVDDNKENLDLVAYFLKPQDYDLITAMDGVEALQKVEQEKPDMILLDIMLPKMDGFQVCERIKKNPSTQFIPIIMITALKELKDKIHSLEVGADDFISKPFENVELLARVKSLLRLKFYHDELVRKNKELEEKNKQLVRMDQFKEDLSHLIVHDMKNPLFVIQGNLQMMSMGMDESTSTVLKKYVDRIERSSQNLLRMVMNLIDISKIEDGSMELSLELGSFNELVEKCQKKIWDYPENSSKTVEMKLDPNLPLVKLDTSVMERVFDNLISFGVANVPTDGHVEIETGIKDGQVYFAIHDFGIQIPIKYGENMFDKFRQIEIKNEGYRIGRGLGLTFCKLAVEAHGGKLWVDTENKTGNRFVFTLPVKNK